MRVFRRFTLRALLVNIRRDFLREILRRLPGMACSFVFEREQENPVT